MSAEREELCRLIQELPGEEVPAVLGAGRPRLHNESGVAANLVRRLSWPDL